MQHLVKSLFKIKKSYMQQLLFFPVVFHYHSHCKYCITGAAALDETTLVGGELSYVSQAFETQLLQLPKIRWQIMLGINGFGNFFSCNTRYWPGIWDA